MEKCTTKYKFRVSNVFILLFVIVLSCASLIVLNGYTIKILSASRAYVNGESHYSKAQKDAVRHLITYLYTHNKKHWELYNQEMRVPQGDGMARIGLETELPTTTIKRGFIEGRNSHKDLDDIIWLFKTFYYVPFMNKAIKEWEQGDRLINELSSIGNKVNQKITEYDLNAADRQGILLEISDISDKLTVNERNFSNTLGEGTHIIKDYLIYTNIFFILIIISTVSIYYHIMVRRIMESNREIEINNQNLIIVNKELDKFVYSASHDLRSPITSLKGLVEIAKDENNLDEIRKYLDLMNQSLTRQDQFISDIIDYSRNKRMEFKNEKVNLNDTIDEVISQHRHIKDANEIQIHKDLAVKQVQSDPLRLKIILNNLVSNAIKYSDKNKSSKFIQIKASRLNKLLKIEIQDNGIGIKDEFIDKIFDMFFVTNTNLGSGLGLYITKEAVENLNGTIDVNSKIDIGTTFTVTIPLHYEM
ncbi:HAMP domain-containing histidine kinase [Flavobacterium amniphilum]|uniref:sensor histidine kinase n=1 Tax=Flavobacterium amniphilum TaxID=1834035 RepID=UPI00202A2E23|nr:HAMP domain-containing sensor histidine kinase [Flavobacterium amniphilum]MCL9805665.1 HAMP domain-containing histidine kinase [Flavobacterium amniphilum]